MKVLVSDCVNMTVGIVWYKDADMVRVIAPWMDSYRIHILHLHPHPRNRSFSSRNKMCLYIEAATQGAASVGARCWGWMQFMVWSCLPVLSVACSLLCDVGCSWGAGGEPGQLPSLLLPAATVPGLRGTCRCSGPKGNHDCLQCQSSESLLTFMGCLTAVWLNPCVLCSGCSAWLFWMRDIWGFAHL